MSMMPRKVKYRKSHRGRMKGVASSGAHLSFGRFGLQTLECHWITARQIEAARVAINRHCNRSGKLWIRLFPDKPVSKKPAETRMGKGKGDTEHWVAVVRPGRIMFELDGVPEALAREALRLAAYKLPVRTKFVMRTR